MLYYDRIDISEGIDPTKSNKSKEYMICSFLIIYLHIKNIKIMYAMVAMIWQC